MSIVSDKQEYSPEDLFQLLPGVSEKDFFSTLTSLQQSSYIQLVDDDGDEIVRVRPGLSWEDYSDRVSELAIRILLLLTEAPTTFFVLQNTQSGKLSITAREVKKWAENVDYKVITFFISSNDRTLTDQSADGIASHLDQNVFVLSSNSRVDISTIKKNILSYAADPLGEYKMPVIAALSNRQQNARVLELIDYIHQLAEADEESRGMSSLRYGIIFDEADTTYPILREQIAVLDDIKRKTKASRQVSFRSLFSSKRFLHRLGFVTATEGCLMGDEYPECARAQLYHAEKDEFASEHYRAIHTRDAVIHEVDQPKNMKNNVYAMKVIKENYDYFFSKKSGVYRKIIVHSNSLTMDMELFAEECVEMGMNALVFNMNGISIFTPDGELPEVATKKKRFNKVLFDVVEENKLDARPLVIIGRRKVDRGLSFHYAPRDGSRGLIWTDIILGRIEDVSSAVQKAGRMAGVIAHCPQYTGECHYWTTSDTRDRCVRKNRINDEANRHAETSSLKKSLQKAVSSVGLPEEESQAMVPVVIKMTRVQLEEVMSSEFQRRANTMRVLEKNRPELAEYLGEYRMVRCQVPESDESYRNQVEYPIECARLGKKLSKSIPAESKSHNCYNVFIDVKGSNLVVIVWNGKGQVAKGCCYVKQRGKYKGEKCGKKCESDSNMCAKHAGEATYKKVIIEDDDE
jgi:hypothetical protein